MGGVQCQAAINGHGKSVEGGIENPLAQTLLPPDLIVGVRQPCENSNVYQIQLISFSHWKF